MLKFIYTLFFLVVVSSCKEEASERISLLDYFSIRLVQEAIYDVEEINYSAGQNIGISNKYQEKVVVKDIHAANNQDIITCEIYIKNDTDINWTFSSIEKIELNPLEVIKTVNQIPYRILIQPVINNNTWDGNVYNNIASQTYKYSFDKDKNELRVIENEKETLIDKYSKYSVYQKGVGLIYEEDVALEYCQTQDCIGEYKIESGYIKTKILVIKDS